MRITLRYYAAAQAAAGVAQEEIEVPDGAALAEALEAALAVVRVPAGRGADASGMTAGRTVATATAAAPTSAPPLGQVLRRCSFLVNEVAAKDRSRTLAAGDVVDVLPPFAGG